MIIFVRLGKLSSMHKIDYRYEAILKEISLTERYGYLDIHIMEHQ